MSKIEAWFRRNFYSCVTIYDCMISNELKIGDIYFQLSSQKIKYIYVGNNKLYIKKS